MTNKRSAVEAQVIQVLDWYDRPELLLLEGPPFVYTLAVRCADVNQEPNVYVGGSMTFARLRDYANGKCDLRFAIAHANLRKFWRFTLTDLKSPVTMEPIKRSDKDVVASIPSFGLFATDHEDIDIAKSFVPNTIERFNVDGGWDLGEFSQFYSQIEDIYYISTDIERFDSPNLTPQEKVIIKDAFDRSWGGGGSYLAFYKKVANDNDFHAPLRVSGIKYNSPGYVSIHARSQPFQNLMVVLQSFADEEANVLKAASALGQFMSRSGMKKVGYSAGLMQQSQRDKLSELSEKLCGFFPGIEFATLVEMTNGNVLVASKVLESIFRRVQRLYRFFDQGRVSHPGLTVK